MSEYKLTYFNSRGLAEPIRWILSLAGVPFEDVRIEKEQWPELKPKFTWGQVPVLEFDGKQLSQSASISRYLAKKYKLAGADELEAAKCDEYVDALGDLRKDWGKFHFESDETKKAELKKTLLEVQVPKYFQKFSNIVEANGGKWLVGSNPTWADLQVAAALELFEIVVDPTILESYPKLKQLKENVFLCHKLKNGLKNALKQLSK